MSQVSRRTIAWLALKGFYAEQVVIPKLKSKDEAPTGNFPVSFTLLD